LKTPTLFRLSRQPDNKARAAPNLNVVTVNQAPRVSDSFVIVTTYERFESYEMPVNAHCVRPIFGHLRPPAQELTDHKNTFLSVRFQTQVPHFSSKATHVFEIEMGHRPLKRTTPPSVKRPAGDVGINPVSTIPR
jgi:hypothetical protein